MKILIMGLPGSGKTTLAEKLHCKLIPSKWYNADDVRRDSNDWDFSAEGRIRQAERMRSLAEDSEAYGFPFVICDFVAPTQEIRDIFNADFTIWMNTIQQSRFTDTDSQFEPPKDANCIVYNYNDKLLMDIVEQVKCIKNME